MLMPKAAPNLNYFLTATKNQIGFSGKIPRVKTIAITHPVDNRTHSHFRIRILTFYATHVFAASPTRNTVHYLPFEPRFGASSVIPQLSEGGAFLGFLELAPPPLARLVAETHCPPDGKPPSSPR